MTITMPEPTDGALALPPSGLAGDPSQGLATLQAWAEGMKVATTAVADLIWTDFVPLHHWPMPPGQTLRTFGNPRMKHPQETDADFERRARTAIASAAATAMHGISVGLPPQIALAQMYSIHGKLGMHTKIRRDLATARGIHTWDVKLTEDEVTCAGTNPITARDVEITITMEQARKAGWTDNAAYSKTPIDMLWSRAMGRVLDRVAGHVLNGIATLDDLRDAEIVESTPVTARVTSEDLKARSKRTAVTPPQVAADAAADAAYATQAAADDVAAGPEPVEPPVAVPEPEAMIDERTWRNVNDLFVGLGVVGPGSRNRRMDILNRLIDRPEPIGGGSELTAVEADLILDTLRGLDAAGVVDLMAEPEQPPTPSEPDVEDPPAEPAGWQQ